MEIEKKVNDALSSLSGDLGGRFYPLTNMKKDVQQRLIDDHFLFKEGDRFLEVKRFDRWTSWINCPLHLRIFNHFQKSAKNRVFGIEL